MTGFARSLPKKKLPSYLLHKPTGQARVQIAGKDYYLGPFGSDESRRRYGEVISRVASGLPPTDPMAKSNSTDGSLSPMIPAPVSRKSVSRSGHMPKPTTSRTGNPLPRFTATVPA